MQAALRATTWESGWVTGSKATRIELKEGEVLDSTLFCFETWNYITLCDII